MPSSQDLSRSVFFIYLLLNIPFCVWERRKKRKERSRFGRIFFPKHPILSIEIGKKKIGGSVDVGKFEKWWADWEGGEA